MDTYQQLAASILVAHQRRDSASCLCGWSHLGRSHAEHVAGVLADAGALQVVPADRGALGDLDRLRRLLRAIVEGLDEGVIDRDDAIHDLRALMRA